VGSLLAVDCGIKTGFALYGYDGRLRWYRSQNFGAVLRLKRGIKGMMKEMKDVRWLILEGGGEVADLWTVEAYKKEITVIQISAEKWRDLLLIPRYRRSGEAAKKSAVVLARRVIEWGPGHVNRLR